MFSMVLHCMVFGIYKHVEFLEKFLQELRWEYKCFQWSPITSFLEFLNILINLEKFLLKLTWKKLSKL